MIELRWKLDPEHPEEYKEIAPLDAFTLQYRHWTSIYNHPSATVMIEREWSEWKDVPFVSEGE